MPEDRPYRTFIRLKPCVVAVARGSWDECDGVMEFCHDQHSGMGGKDVPDRGNSFPGCSGHHTKRKDSYHQMGRESFEKHHGIDKIGGLKGVCAQLDREYEFGVAFLDEEPYGAGLRR